MTSEGSAPERLVGFADELDDLRAWAREGDLANIDRIEDTCKGCQHAFHQRAMATEETLIRKLGILEVGGKWEEFGFVFVLLGQCGF